MFNLNKKIEKLEKKVYLSSPTMHGLEFEYIKDAYDTNWMSTVGKNLDEIEKQIADFTGNKYAVALASGTAALHLAMKISGIKKGEKVFCSDLTFDATVNPVSYEGGTQIFIDSEYDTWNMDPVALEKAFKIYPDVKYVVLAHLYGTPSKMSEILDICNEHNAILIEDAAESFGAKYKGKQTGTFGTLASIISFNGNKIITGSSGGMLLTNDKYIADKVRKWSTQSRENAPWYQHEELGYNYRMSNLIAGVIRGQLPYLNEHIKQKKNIYDNYQKAFKDLPISMNPFLQKEMEPNFWLSCILINNDYMCKQVRSDKEALYIKENNKTCPTEIMEHILNINAECRPIWKPMHMQPIYINNDFITVEGSSRGSSNAYGGLTEIKSVSEDIFNRGLCLPSDNKMTNDEQNRIIEVVKNCFE